MPSADRMIKKEQIKTPRPEEREERAGAWIKLDMQMIMISILDVKPIERRKDVGAC